MWPVSFAAPRVLTKEQQTIMDRIRALNIRAYHFTAEETTHFSILQIAICTLRYNKVSYRKIIKLFDLPGPETITTVLKLTARGFNWEKSKMTDGSYPKFPNTFYDTLKQTILARTSGQNCLKTAEAKQLIYDSVEEFNANTIKKLVEWNSPELAANFVEKLDSWECSSQFLHEICDKIGVVICTPELLEEARRKNCNTNTVNKFYGDFSDVMQNVEPKYIYNADETGLAAKKTFKILTSDRNLRISPKEKEMQHISAMCCMSAAGDMVKPMFILPKREHDFPELQNKFGFYYSTSTNGWMTAKLFGIWCIIFISHIQNLRENSDLQNDKDVFLFLDGHSSRFSSFGMRLLKRFRVRCVIFPAHCTHVLQPFDVGIASPLKTAYQRRFINMIEQFRKQHNSNPTAAQLREIRITAFLDAWSSISIETTKKAFAAAGIYPFSKENLAMSRFITDPAVAAAIYTNFHQNDNYLNGAEATRDETILKLPLHATPGIFHGILNPKFIVLDFNQICGQDIAYEWKNGNSSSGKIFSPLHSIFEKGVNLVHGIN